MTDVTVLVPALNEARALPVTLPAILAAARPLTGVEMIVLAGPSSDATTDIAADLTAGEPWARVSSVGPGKLNALRAGAAAAGCELLLTVDADVVPAPGALVSLAAALGRGADLVGGRPTVEMPAQSTRLQRWASMSVDAWHETRMQAEHRWALCGQIYALRARWLAAPIEVPLIEDSALGLASSAAGAVLAYEPEATVQILGPASWRDFKTQKLRTRRGWAALATLDGARVRSLTRQLRSAVWHGPGTSEDRIGLLAADSALRIAGKVTERAEAGRATWSHTSTTKQWAQAE